MPYTGSNSLLPNIVHIISKIKAPKGITKNSLMNFMLKHPQPDVNITDGAIQKAIHDGCEIGLLRHNGAGRYFVDFQVMTCLMNAVRYNLGGRKVAPISDEGGIHKPRVAYKRGVRSMQYKPGGGRRRRREAVPSRESHGGAKSNNHPEKAVRKTPVASQRVECRPSGGHRRRREAVPSRESVREENTNNHPEKAVRKTPVASQRVECRPSGGRRRRREAVPSRESLREEKTNNHPEKAVRKTPVASQRVECRSCFVRVQRCDDTRGDSRPIFVRRRRCDDPNNPPNEAEKSGASRGVVGADLRDEIRLTIENMARAYFDAMMKQ